MNELKNDSKCIESIFVRILIKLFDFAGLASEYIFPNTIGSTEE